MSSEDHGTQTILENNKILPGNKIVILFMEILDPIAGFGENKTNVSGFIDLFQEFSFSIFNSLILVL